MERVTVKLTVFFEHPFWVGVFERVEENRWSVCRVVFGSQSKDYEVYEFVLQQYRHLKFSTGEAAEVKSVKCILQKQKEYFLQRMECICSKSQMALQQQREEMKLERRVESKQQRELEKKRKFQLKQEKRKQKHRGK